MADALGLEEVRRALAEDRADEDVTTRLLGTAAHAPATARFVAEARFVVAGLPIAELIFHELDPRACLESHAAEGDWTEPEATFATLRAGGRAWERLRRRGGLASPHVVTGCAVMSVQPSEGRLQQQTRQHSSVERM